MSGYRPPYTLTEEYKILQYIIDNNAYTMVMGDAFWKRMEKTKVVNRTWQSLKNHFKRYMVPRLAVFNDLPPEEIDKIRIAVEISKRPNTKKNIKDTGLDFDLMDYD